MNTALAAVPRGEGLASAFAWEPGLRQWSSIGLALAQDDFESTPSFALSCQPSLAASQQPAVQRRLQWPRSLPPPLPWPPPLSVPLFVSFSGAWL